MMLLTNSVESPTILRVLLELLVIRLFFVSDFTETVLEVLTEELFEVVEVDAKYVDS